MGKNRIISSLILATLITSLSSQCVYAKSLQNDNHNKNTIEQKQNEKQTIEKLDKYVELDSYSRKFKIKDLAYSELKDNEIDFIKDRINKSNNLIKQDNQLVSNTHTKSFKRYGVDNNNHRVKRTIHKSQYWDVDIFWWGTRLYLHSNLVRDMQEFSATTLAISGAGAAAAMKRALAEFGVKGKAVSIIVTAFEANVGYTYDRIVKANKYMTGVYLDTYWGAGLAGVWKVYSA